MRDGEITAAADVYVAGEIHFPYRFGFQCCVWRASIGLCVAWACLYSLHRVIERHDEDKQSRWRRAKERKREGRKRNERAALDGSLLAIIFPGSLPPGWLNAI